MADRAPVAAVLALLLNALVWGLSWWPFRLLQGHGLHPLWATCLMFSVAVACVFAVAPLVLASWRGQPLLWLLAAASGLTNVGFNWAVTIGDVVRVVLLFYLMPAWSVLLAWPLLGERPTAASIARLLLALAGVMIVLRPEASGWPWPSGLADMLALLGGFSFALTNILLRRLNGTASEARMLAMFGGGAGLALLVALGGMAQGAVPAVPPPTLAWVGVAAALACAFLASNLALQYGAARLRAQTTSLVMLSEIVFAALSSVALGAAQLDARVLLGAALILGAAAWSVWPPRSGATAGAQ